VLDAEARTRFVIDDHRSMNAFGPSIDKHKRRITSGELGDESIADGRKRDEQAIQPSISGQSLICIVGACAVPGDRLCFDHEDEASRFSRSCLNSVDDIGKADIVDTRDD
jgi:hypothetical protein